jgi:ATP-binding cassette, subfamily B, bacterial
MTVEESVSSSGKTAGTIGALLRPHKGKLFLAVLAAIGGGAADLLSPWPLKIVVDAVASKSHTLPAWVVHFFRISASGDKLATVKFAALAALAIAVIGAACSYAQKRATTTVGQWVMHDMRRTLYSHMQRLSLTYHDQTQTGDLISRVTSDIDSIQSFITSGLLDALMNVLTLAGMIGVMFWIDWRFTLIALSVAPVLFVVAFRYTRLIKKSSREVRKKEGEIVSTIQEVLTSIRVVKAFATEEYEQKRLEEQSLESVEMSLRARSLKAKLAPAVEIIVAGGTSLVLWYGARMVVAGALSPGSLVLFISYLGKMYKPMQDLSKMTDSYSKAVVGYERIQEVLHSENDIQDSPGAKRAPKFKGEIEFDNVTFGYEPEHPVITNMSFHIAPGQRAALVGPTGVGKTSVIGLIPRFYQPSSGVIKIDGKDIRSYRQKSLREQISFVLQETVLFHATLWHNIAYGKPDATRAEIVRAAEMANASEFIDKMPQGYDTVVGERGVTLSGGQRQRIAIARAIIRNTPILILDEPTSGLDAGSEKLVFEALDRLMEGRTSIVITHRLSTIRDANVIFVVDHGTIVESGNHEALMQNGGLYEELCRLQLSPSEA